MNGIVEIMKKVAQKEAGAVYTTEIGTVTAVFPHKDKGDKDNYQCSVKLKNKKLSNGKEMELRKVPIASPYMGFACIPNIGDLVLISFIAGNINAPVIIGRLYNDEDRPPVNKEKEFLIQHDVKEGGSIKLDAEGKIIITSKNEKNIVTIEDEKISIAAEEEKFGFVIDISGKKISITSDKDLEFKAKNGKFTVDAKEVSIKSGGKLDLKASGAVKVKGSKVDIN